MRIVNYHVSNGKLFSNDEVEVTPDHNGIVCIEVDGKPKRFVLSKLIAYLESDPTIKRRKRRLKKVETEKGAHKRKPIVAIKNGVEYPFPSSAAAANALKVCRTNIPHALSGRYHHLGGYQFKYANTVNQ